MFLIAASMSLIWINWFGYLLTVVGICIALYILTAAFKLYPLIRSGRGGAVRSTGEEISELKDDSLPRYTIMVPLYREGEVVEGLIEAISNMDYPKGKLEVLLLLEEDDRETMEALGRMRMPENFKKLIVPGGYPKTKPRACNFGLRHATGEYLVIYDAEDRPERDQLKQAALAFRKCGDEKVACFQAKLNFYNPRQNLLTRLFRLEYTFWFDLMLPALSSINAPVPLGGSSNHFRREVLEKIGGWDEFNVAEDCDMGMRLNRKGYRVGVLNSTTWEEAASELGNWMGQRSRWMKGYIQTYLVHMREPVRCMREMGVFNFLTFNMIVGFGTMLSLLNPVFWLMFLWHMASGSAFIESLFPGVIGYMGSFSLIFLNFAFIYLMIISALVREDYDLVKYGLLSPISWVLMSVAGWRGLMELIFKPHYWRKTKHGEVKGI
ncbi:glycosyltransferase [Candidatus Poribacteria bacterium]|nr:glycosyltransferase [Candidatus Poribacteria bacterium]